MSPHQKNKLVFRATRTFRRQFHKLSSNQKKNALRAFEVFRINPFDPRLRPHKINHLSALAKKTIYAVVVDGDLRAVFCQEGNTILTLGIGGHEIYGR